MKTKFYWFALFASAALIAQAQAGGHHGGGGGSFAAAGPGPARSGGSPSFHSMPMQSFGGGRIYSGQRFSSPAFRQPYINSTSRAIAGTRQFTPTNINRADRFSNGENRAITNMRRAGNGAGQVRNGNNLASNWRNHVVAQHSTDWHRDWDRSRDHWWHGHHCRFINDAWFVFDFGFDPWWPYWWYPYDYYANDCMLLLRPEIFPAAILFRAMVPLVPETQPDLSSVRVWIGAGSYDPIIPGSGAKQLAELLRGAGANVTIRFLQGGHELTPDDVDVAREWLAKLK